MRCFEKISPGQVRFYCKEATPNQKRTFTGMGFEKAAMSPNQALGYNTIREMVKEAGYKTGLGVTGQGFRRLFIQTMVNDSGVSVEESLASARHGSVSAQRPYMTRNSKSESAKFDALNLKKP